MNNPIFFDTETVGFCGPITTTQYAYGNDEIQVFHNWKHTVKENIELIESFINHPDGIIGFNLSYDFFHLAQMWTVLKLLEEDGYTNEILENIINEYALREEEGTKLKYCLKPQHCFDIFLWARKTEFQSTMERRDIIIRRVPTILAQELATELNNRVPLRDIYFARKKKDREIHWKVFATKAPEFSNVVLKFAASSGLKALAIDALDLDPEDVLYFGEINVPNNFFPFELPYAPFYQAILRSYPEKKFEAWPNKIKLHIEHWLNNPVANKYAKDDVKHTRELYYYFQERSEERLMDDDDSVLACLVAVCRWKGYSVDLEKVKNLRNKYKELVKSSEVFSQDHVPVGFKQAQEYLAKGFTYEIKQELYQQALIEAKLFISRGSTSKVILQELVRLYHEKSDFPEVGKRAKKILETRDAKYKINFLNKLLVARRLYADLKVIGTLSSRMSGTSKLNVTGIAREKPIRKCFTLANQDKILLGGDFISHEVALAAAKYNDPRLTEDLCSCRYIDCKYQYNPANGEFLLDHCPKCKRSEIDKKGKKENTLQKIHALFAMELFPGKSYQDILDSKGTAFDMYGLGKNGVFSMVYGGDWGTLVRKYGISEEAAKLAEEKFQRKYPNIRKAREKTKRNLCSMIQPDGIGSKVIWRDPVDYVESMLGFKRYFTLENQICKALFDLANSPPKKWRDLRIPIVRRDRIQMVGGAVQSALYGAAFGIQSSNMRAGENHQIQSTGSQINKRLQTEIWNLQPKGISEWIVQPLNVHDELQIPTDPRFVKQVESIIHKVVESFRPLVPLIGFDYKVNMQSWGDK